MKKILLLTLLCWASAPLLHAQLLTLPNATNPAVWAGRRVGLTDISIHWNAPGVKGREGNIWGTYFYKPEEDALRVTVRQQKDLP